MDRIYVQAAEELMHIAGDLDRVEETLGKSKPTADEMESQIDRYDHADQSKDPNMSQHALAQDYTEVLNWYNSAEGQDPKIMGEGEKDPDAMSLEAAQKAANGLNRKYEYPSGKKAYIRKSSHKKLASAAKQTKK